MWKPYKNRLPPDPDASGVPTRGTDAYTCPGHLPGTVSRIPGNISERELPLAVRYIDPAEKILGHVRFRPLQ